MEKMIWELVGELDGVIKYAPMLQDMAASAGAVDIDAMSDKDRDAAITNADAALHDKAFSFAKTCHAKAMDNLRTELLRPEYKGKSDAEVIAMLTIEQVVTDKESGLTFTVPPVLGRIWHGIPYTRNVPRVKDIQEAR